MKRFLFILICLFTINTFGQQSFFETIASHGKNAEYLNFYQVYVTDDGKQQTSSPPIYTNTIEQLDYSGMPSGIKVFVHYEDGKSERTFRYDAVKESTIDFIGFPNTSMLYHGGYNRAFVAMGNYVFFLEGISNDKLDFREISKAFVLKGTTVGKSKNDNKKKKKKGFGKFLSKVKDAALNQGNSKNNQPSGPEYDALMSQDVRKMIKDYLKAMKVKQDAYNMSAKDKADLATLKNAAKEYDEYVREKNAAFWNSPEGQVVLRNRENTKLAEQRHMKFCRLTKELCGQVIHPSY